MHHYSYKKCPKLRWVTWCTFSKCDKNLQMCKRFQPTLDMNRTCRRHMLTEEKLDKSDARLYMSSRKSLVWLSQQTGMPASSAWLVTKLLHLHPLWFNKYVSQTLWQFDMWCAMSANGIIGFPPSPETMNSHQYVTNTLTPFLENKSGYNSVCCLETVSDERIIGRGLWPHC
jgi:hypothetical protein